RVRAGRSCRWRWMRILRAPASAAVRVITARGPRHELVRVGSADGPAGLPHLLAGRKSRLESRLATHARRPPGRDVGQPIGAETYPATHAACVCRAAFHPGGLASPILLAPLENELFSARVT